MNWPEIARGAWPDNAAFAALSWEERKREIEEALRWALERQLSQPHGSQRVASAALHLMDGHGLAYPMHRTWLSYVIGDCAIRLGDTNSGGAILRKLIAGPSVPGTEEARIAAAICYADLVGDTDPDLAIAMLRDVTSTSTPAEAPDDSTQPAALPLSIMSPRASAAVSLGALLRRTGSTDEARQVFEEAITECNAVTPPLNTVLARLHGNLGNLFFNDLQDYAQAADHYFKSASRFDAAGEANAAARRYFNLVDARLMGGEYDEALRLLREGDRRIADNLDEFRKEVIEQASWADGADPAAWEEFFASVRKQHAAESTPQAEATFIAATIILRLRLGDEIGAIRLAHDARLELLTRSRLLGMLLLALDRLSKSHGCHGVLWPIIVSHEELHIMDNDAVRNAIKSYFASEAAAIWLLDKTRSATAEETLRIEAVQGIGAVPSEPPAWLGSMDAGVRQRFIRLRSLFPGTADLTAEIREILSASRGPDSRVVRGIEDSLRKAIYFADMLGDPQLQGSARRALARCVMRSDRPARDRHAELVTIMKEAKAIARGIPIEQFNDHITMATLLKESVAGDESVRLATAIDEARNALKIAEDRHYDNAVAASALTLGNALMEYEDATLDHLREAASVLQHGIETFQVNLPMGLRDESALFNSLGKVHSMLGDRESSAEQYIKAIDYMEKAFGIRDQAGDTEGSFRVAANLLGAYAQYNKLSGVPYDDKVLIPAARVVQMAPQIHNIELLCTTLANACVVYRELDIVAAKDIAAQAVTAARALGASPPFFTSLLNASSVYLKAGDVNSARELLEEAGTMLEGFRQDSGVTRYRAELTERFDDIYRVLERTLEESGAPVADTWWAVERNTGRTLLEGVRQRKIQLDQASVMQSLGNLPADTAVIETYVNSRGAYGYFYLQARDGRVQIQKGAHSVPVRAMAQGMGGSADKRRVWTPVPTPERAAEFNLQMSWLGTHFLGPVLAEMDLRGVTRIVIINQQFAYMPWHAVPVPPAETPLGATWEVVSVPSAATLAHLLSTPRPELSKAAFVACDPSGKLRQHIQECRHAFSVLEVPEKVVLTDTSRTVTTHVVREFLSEADLFHFSGHSTMTPGEPKKSGLLLSDGLLTVPELEQALSHRAPSLVFLSSCESGAADLALRDAATLSTVFLQAGAHVVIGASWRVPDFVAARTARKFYENLRTHGAVRSLKIAQANLMGNPAVGANWATFRLQGWE